MITLADRTAVADQVAVGQANPERSRSGPGRLADPMRPQLYRITRVWRELADTVTFALVAEDPAEPLAFAPGQFNMLYAPGIGEIPISISGDPGHPETLIHTIRSVGPVSRALCHLRRGDLVGVRGPFGRHWPVEAAGGR